MFSTYSYLFELPKDVQEGIRQALIEEWGDVPPEEISRRMGFITHGRIGNLMSEIDVQYWIDKANHEKCSTD